MDVIERKINLEEFRSRRPSLIPYIGIEYRHGLPVFPEHGNWGEIPYDIDICKCSGYDNLKVYFGYDGDSETARVSFRELVKKFRLLRRILDEADYFELIQKEGVETWVEYTPNLGEKHSLNVFSSLSEVPDGLTKVGLSEDDSFNKNGGVDMMRFLLKAMGVFMVDLKYVGDNYVPEMMTYCETAEQLRTLRRLRKGEDCCADEEYELHGGDDFLFYVMGKVNEMEGEIRYWRNALYRDEDGNPVGPDMVLDVALSSDFHSVGIYTPVEGTGSEAEMVGSESGFTTGIETTRLPYLRSKKVNYCERTVDGEIFDEELPFILVEKGNDKLKAVNPYEFMANKVQNASTVVEDGTLQTYGDVIHSFEIGGNEVTVTYVIGARMNGSEPDRNTGVWYTETYPCEYRNYAADPERSYPMMTIWGNEIDGFSDSNFIEGADKVLVFDVPTTAETVGWTQNITAPGLRNDRVIMLDYNFGRDETLVENVDEVVIDRGYISALELHYKIGEVNTMDDLVKYGNNIFGL